MDPEADPEWVYVSPVPPVTEGQRLASLCIVVTASLGLGLAALVSVAPW